MSPTDDSSSQLEIGHLIHLDTDLGGDIDDLCALAMLLRWPGVEVAGITTVCENEGRRAGYVKKVLELAGKSEIPVAAGAENRKGFYRYFCGLPAEERYWPEPVAPSPNPIKKALSLLKNSIEQGATIIGIGPFTNLFLLDRMYPSILEQAKLFLMGGYVYPPRPGFPGWGNEVDFNIQVDVKSAMHVLQHAHPTLIPLSITVETALRRAYLNELAKTGRLGQLVARQALAFAEDEKMEARFGKTCPGLPPDIINFQHDPLASAIALGWDEGIEIEELPLIVEEGNGWLTERIHPDGKPFRVVTKVDGERFSEFWFGQMTGKQILFNV
jgi:purine nucleosidase